MNIVILFFLCVRHPQVQASALMAENVVVPMLVIHMLQAHVTNFHNEMDQYLAVLAVNKGSLASSKLCRETPPTHAPSHTRARPERTGAANRKRFKNRRVRRKMKSALRVVSGDRQKGGGGGLSVK